MIRYFRLALAALLFGGVAAQPAAAQGILIPRPVRPIPVVQPLAVKSQKVTMNVTDGALKVEVEQVYLNPNSVPMEGTYLFPLPRGAAVSSFRLLIDREPVEGKILDVDAARRVYESYVRRNVDPAILRYVGQNAFQAQVFPIGAGGERRIYLGYSQPLDFNGGIYQAVYPLGADHSSGQPVGDLVIDATIRSKQPIRTVYSPTHEIQVKRESDHLARATFESKGVLPGKDFVLYYTTSEKTFGLNALAHRRPGEDGYVMLMLAPRREVAAAEVQPKDVVFVVDTSGSMQGAKIEQARKALHTVLGALNREDRFNILRFSSDVASFRPGVVPADAENRAAARAFVDEIKAVGGTAIDDALQAALASLPKPEDRRGRTPFVIFMTDGLPTIGVTDIDKILKGADKAAPPDLRLFSFGVGTDVNTLLLDRLAADHRGAADYIAQDEDLETKIGAFYTKIADPVLANVQVAVEGAKLQEIYPSRIPDLFAGTQLLVLARYTGQGAGRVTLTGELNGKPQRYTYEVSFPERELGQEFIPKLWASRRIGFLLEQIRLNGESKELKDEVIRLSKEFGIVTPYTAYLVEEPGLPSNQPVPLLGTTRFGALDAAGGVPGPAGPQGGQGGFGGGYAMRGGRSDERLPERDRGYTPAPAARPAPGAIDAAKKLPEQSQLRLKQQADGFGRSTGSNAVEASRRLRELKDQERDETEIEVTRTVEGRRFRRQGDAWKDDSIKEKMKVVEVKYGSDAYFSLVAAKPAWAKFLSLGRKVAFRSGAGTWVSISDKGAEKLSAAELKALEK